MKYIFFATIALLSIFSNYDSSNGQTTPLSLRSIPDCASIRIIKYSPSGKYIFIRDEKRQAFLITKNGDLVQRWVYKESNYDSVWNKQIENQVQILKLNWSLERQLEFAKKLPDEYAKRYLANVKAYKYPVVIPPNGLIIGDDTVSLPQNKDREKILPQYFDNGYFANDSLLFINASISTLSLDTFKLQSATTPSMQNIKSMSILEYSIPDKKENFTVLKANFDKNTYPTECWTTFAAKDSSCKDFLFQFSFDTYPNDEDFIKRSDFQALGSVGLYNRTSSELVRTYGIIPESYRIPDIFNYASTELYAVPKSNDTLNIVYAIWDSVQVCVGSQITTYPLHIFPNNDLMFYGVKGKMEGFSKVYSRKNFYILQAEQTRTNSMVIVIYQKDDHNKWSWLVREYDNNWNILKEKRIEESIGGNKIYYTGYKVLDNTICYVTMDTNKTWQLHYIPF